MPVQATMKTLHILVAVIISLQLSAAYAESDPLQAFPSAAEGMTRLVIELPTKTRDEERQFKVELVAGKTMMSDGVNLLRLGTNIEARPLKGWGYTYYQVSASVQAISTMMAAPQGSEAVQQFVTGSPLLIPYNSRLPVVIYAPLGYQVHYRVWQAPDHTQTASQG